MDDIERMSGYECKEKAERKSDQAEIQHAANVETEISVIDVGSLPDLADHFQVHTPVGMDDGVPGGETKDLPLTDLAASLCRI